MGERTPTERRMQIRGFLASELLHQTWMVLQLNRRGYLCDRTELNGALTGQRSFPKSKKLLDGCETVIQEYQSTFGKLTEKRKEGT